jgi:hypothetical protein
MQKDLQNMVAEKIAKNQNKNDFRGRKNHEELKKTFS